MRHVRVLLISRVLVLQESITLNKLVLCFSFLYDDYILLTADLPWGCMIHQLYRSRDERPKEGLHD